MVRCLAGDKSIGQVRERKSSQRCTTESSQRSTTESSPRSCSLSAGDKSIGTSCPKRGGQVRERKSSQRSDSSKRESSQRSCRMFARDKSKGTSCPKSEKGNQIRCPFSSDNRQEGVNPKVRFDICIRQDKSQVMSNTYKFQHES